MKVKVIQQDLNNINRIMYTAARTCYSKKDPITLYDESKNMTNDEMEKLITRILDSGHLSVAEHCNFNIMVSGITRATSHQLVRHRHCSYSQQSQRYCQIKDNFEYEIPNKISDNKELKRGFQLAMKTLSDLYNYLIDNNIKAEDARAILPNATLTNIFITSNLRELMHICNERLCTCAQYEIRRLFIDISNQVINMIPWTKKYLVPKCEKLGYCNESKERSCGRKNTR